MLPTHPQKNLNLSSSGRRIELIQLGVDSLSLLKPALLNHILPTNHIQPNNRIQPTNQPTNHILPTNQPNNRPNNQPTNHTQPTNHIQATNQSTKYFEKRLVKIFILFCLICVAC